VVDKVNRGGLFDVSDERFHLFVAVEMAMRQTKAHRLLSISEHFAALDTFVPLLKITQEVILKPLCRSKYVSVWQWDQNSYQLRGPNQIHNMCMH